MKQENCPVCGRLMETFETESGRQVQICDRSSDAERPYVRWFPCRALRC